MSSNQSNNQSLSHPQPQLEQPAAEFGVLKPVIVSNRRYMLITDPSLASQSQTSSKDQLTTNSNTTKNNTPHNKANKGSFLATPDLSKSTRNEFSPTDVNGHPKTSIHGIPIIYNSKSEEYSLMFTFPALLGPSLTSTYANVVLPPPTPGGSILLMIAKPTLSELLQQYQRYFNTVMAARMEHPYTHFFGVPLGPVNPICYDFNEKSEKRVIDRVEHYSDDNANLSDYRFHTEFMQSETAQSLALNVVKMYKKMGLESDSALDMVVMKHNNYTDNTTRHNKSQGRESPESAEVPNDLMLHRCAAMPIPKLHCTLFLMRILSRDEFNLVISTLQTAQQVVYDALGGTSVSLLIKNTIEWNPGKGKWSDKAKHYVATLQEVYKDGKLSAADHIATGKTTPEHSNPDHQSCPRLAHAVGILAHALAKVGMVTPGDYERQSLGTTTGQNCGVKWHMTLFNSKYAQSAPNGEGFMLSIPLCRKGANSIQDWGRHRVPCINLYRMGSKFAIPKDLSHLYDQKFADFPSILPQRHQVKEHYIIDATLPMP